MEKTQSQTRQYKSGYEIRLDVIIQATRLCEWDPNFKGLTFDQRAETVIRVAKTLYDFVGGNTEYSRH